MKTFANYLSESQKTYEFRIKLANVDPAEKMDQIENALNAYGLESISKPKRLPLKESDIDFPNFGTVELHLMDAVLTYPVNDYQLRTIIAERTGIAQANIVVVPKNHPEEIWRWNEEGESELKEYKKGEAVLDKEYDENPDAKKAGETYAKQESILKELNKPEFEIEGNDDTPEGNAGKTLNDEPTNQASPVGSTQNKLPDAK